MANTDAPFGGSAIGTSDGSDYHGKSLEVEFASSYATNVFIGDPVKLTGTTGADGFTPQVERAAAGDAFIGFLESVTPDFEDEGNLSKIYHPASTAQKGIVAAGSDVLFAIQEDSVGGDLAITDAGLNANLIIGAGSTLTGMSGVEIDSSSAASTSTLQVRLLRVRNAVGNALGTNAQWVVNINSNQNDHGTGV